jgi:hypothetical protein
MLLSEVNMKQLYAISRDFKISDIPNFVFFACKIDDYRQTTEFPPIIPFVTNCMNTKKSFDMHCQEMAPRHILNVPTPFSRMYHCGLQATLPAEMFGGSDFWL